MYLEEFVVKLLQSVSYGNAFVKPVKRCITNSKTKFEVVFKENDSTLMFHLIKHDKLDSLSNHSLHST